MLNVIVEPGQASRIACRKLPPPLFAFEVTTGLVRQGTTITVAEAESLSEFGSPVAARTVAVLWYSVSLGLTGIWRVSVNVVTLPKATLGFVQFTVPPDPTDGVVHVHPAGVGIETNVKSPGSTSFKAAPSAASGPLFVTVIV